jgi:hypothetical protein
MDRDRGLTNLEQHPLTVTDHQRRRTNLRNQLAYTSDAAAGH